MYIDTHAHYDNERFRRNRKELLGRLQKSEKIAKIINCAITYESNLHMREELAECRKIVFSTGIHPNAVEDWGRHEKHSMERVLRALAEESVGIGETGLDYFRGKSDTQCQQEWFQRQITIALDTEKPFILHIRGERAEEDALDILKRFGNVHFAGVLHCFSHPDYVEDWLKLGFHLGIGGMITREDCSVNECLRTVPLERLLLETDCPFVKPQEFGEKQNNSFSIPIVIQKLAEIRGVSAAAIEHITTENAKSLFSLELSEAGKC